MSLAELRKRQAAMLDKLTGDIQKIEDGPKTNRVDDSRYWKPQAGSDGNGSATIRFLPPKAGEDVAFVHYYKYQFKWPKTGKYYYERSLSTLGLPDPVAEYKKQLREEGNEELSKKMGRTEKYISNILVIKDPVNPENDGKVFLYEYGKQIFDKIKKAMTDDPEVGRDAFNPFDFDEGKNFILKIKKKSEFLNYEDSLFVEKSTPLAKSDDKIEEILNQCYSLEAENASDKYLSYDELKTKLDKVLGLDASGNSTQTSYQKNIATVTSGKKPVDLDDDIPYDKVSSDSDIDDLLKGMDDILAD